MIQFDRPVDKASVAARFSLTPGAAGRISWPTSRQLVFRHATLHTDTEYRVRLTAGYRSRDGGATDLEHTWTFRTEGALQVTGWAPGGGERDVDPAAYLAVTFNHPLSAASLAGAFVLDPITAVAAHLDPADPHRALIVPQGLLQPDQTYTLHALRSVRDANGNPLPAAASSSFQTGSLRPLHGWLSYLQSPPGALPGAAGSLWIVDSNRLPRQLVPSPVLAYTWSPAGDELALETAPRTWSDLPVGGTPAPLGLAADWVAPLGTGHGFVFLDRGSLGLLTPAGQPVVLATGVDSAALSPDAAQVAYTIPVADGTEVWTVTLELRSRSRLQAEPGSVTGLAWSPDEGKVAYVVAAADGQARVRVRALTQGTATTAVAGTVSDPAWDADSQHLFVLGQTGSPPSARIYHLPLTGSPQTLSGSGLPQSSSQEAGPPEVAPDGHQVAFVAGGEVWLMNADGTGLTRLTAPGYSCSEPLWTPA